MNIVFATSDLYSNLGLITIKSLLMNNTEADEINIFYIGNQISEDNKSDISSLVAEYGRHIEFIEMPENMCPISGFLRKNEIVYTYCYLHNILPKYVDKALLLETDVIVRGNIDELYSMDISDYYLAAADDLQSKWYKRKLGIGENQPYFNSGILLINLKKWRESNIADGITEVIASGNHKFFYEVQDEMNVFFAGKVKIFPPKFNAATSLFLFDYKNMLRYRWPSTCCTEQEFDESRKNPVIVHFTTNRIIQSRPWIEGCTHPFNDCYIKIKNETARRDMPLWENKQGIFNKLIYFIYSKISKTFIALSIGMVHSFLYPCFLYNFFFRGKT